MTRVASALIVAAVAVWAAIEAWLRIGERRRTRWANVTGCDCTELCAMGPTCPGGGLAGLPGAGCWRTGEDA